MPGTKRAWNNLISIVVDPALPGAGEAVAAEVRRFADWVRTARPRNPGDEILLPGDIERRTRADRLANGIPFDAATLDQIAEAGASVGVPRAEVEALAQ